MEIRIKRVDTTLPLPEYKTKGAVAFDLYSRINEVIPPRSLKLIPANFIIGTPEGYMLMLAARSSLASKKGLMMGNGIGTIDQDYCGEEDELKLNLYNFTDTAVAIEKGERLAQGIFVKIEKGNWNEVEKMSNESRGGFGTTGQF
ncbi:MAG TPA: dUTP diphosphatase [Candidatus Magasanikbacteria bacterium]|nr:dUTP diphosphatase [Candidatus Magasanikbacteria bacterium]